MGLHIDHFYIQLGCICILLINQWIVRSRIIFSFLMYNYKLCIDTKYPIICLAISLYEWNNMRYFLWSAARKFAFALWKAARQTHYYYIYILKTNNFFGETQAQSNVYNFDFAYKDCIPCALFTLLFGQKHKHFI